jgi:hypothetical protein
MQSRMWPAPERLRRNLLGTAIFVLASAAGTAHAADSGADGGSRARMQDDARAYYGAEVSTSFLFVGYGAVTAGAGGASLTQAGDFAHGFGWSSLILGGVTALGGAGYGLAAKLRGDYYSDLAANDPVRYKREEGERIEGTTQRFPLYLGYEIVQTLAGIGIASYGLAAKNDLWRGVGIGTAIQGIGLFVIDAPGAGRAARYRDQVRQFNPEIGLSIGGPGRPWAATIGQRF